LTGDATSREIQMTMTTTAATYPPLPVITPLTQFFWDGLRERRLLILRCQSCGHYVHYPRPVCNRCRSIDLAPEEVSGRGTLYAYTVTMQAFHPYFVDKIPYTLALVELDEQRGLRITTTIVDCPEDELKTGMAVELVWTDVAPDLTLPLFRSAA
jgi:uncharacterized OB-fold protein